MKKLWIIILLFFLIPNFASAEKPEGVKCPKPEQLIATDVGDKEELLKALNDIVPTVYGTNPEYQKWEVEVIAPMPYLTGFEVNYYKMAENFCGKEVADLSWFVRLRFPRLLPAQSASLGELYIVKNKNDKWVAWFQYH